MRFDKIPAHEKRFFDTGKSSSGTLFSLREVAITDLNYTKVRPADGSKGYYYDDKFEKTSAILHFTEGYLKGDIDMLTQGGHVSVPFLLPRNGKILSLYPSSGWSYHLGPKASGGNTAMSKKTIPIEICNIGALKREGDNLITKYGDAYCHVNDHAQYHQFTDEWRGYNYFASFTNEQYDALTHLLMYLNLHRGIEFNFLPEESRYDKLSAEDVANFKGILSHINFRDDLDENDNYKKTDIGRGFQWNRIINSLK